MVQTAIMRLISLFPIKDFKLQVDIHTYNAQNDEEYQRIRDFFDHALQTQYQAGIIILGILAKNMSVPEMCKNALICIAHGRIFRIGEELFARNQLATG